jgi:GTP-binding protein
MNIISIIGNANVGKSTLFNKLVIGPQRAITSDFSGVTRDYKMAEAQLANLKFKLIDTAGLSLMIGSGKDLRGQMERQTIAAISKSDLILFMVDGTRGVTEHDKSIAAWLKKKALPAILVINKADVKQSKDNFYDFYHLGYDNLCVISAEHNSGFDQLYDAINDIIESSLSNKASPPEQEDQRHIKIAIIGRPNVGKSTLINSFLNEERVITGKEAGTTRDSIFIDINYNDEKIQLIDTAGVRKRSKIIDHLEKMAMEASIKAIRLCDVAVLITDINTPLEKQDLKLASIALEEELKPLVVVMNKIDSLKVDKDLYESIDHVVKTKLSQKGQGKVLYISALNKKNINDILDECILLYKRYSTRISTSKLNAWLEKAMLEHQPPLSKLGRRIKIKFISQIGSAPPVFQIFSNHSQEISDQYLRYLASSLQSHFKLQGVPVKLCKIKSKNPYA